MFEAEFGRVKGGPIESPRQGVATRTSVYTVAHDGHSDGCEVNTNLVRPPRLGSNLEQRHAGGGKSPLYTP